MAWTISPDNYDVVVIGSGLPECLVAASLVKSGKSVLIIDAVDTYGTDFASFTPAALQSVLKQGQQHDPRYRTGSGAAGTPTPADANDSHQQQGREKEEVLEHEHSLPRSCPLANPLPPGCRLLRLRQRPLPMSGIRALAVAGEEGGGPADRRSYIFDLVPKLVYQSEALVDLLVRCRCHHYLEFKAVEGSYVLQEGGLQPVPAGKADIFRDRRLSLADKRLLMRFIAGCVEARSGQGRLKDALSGSLPLAQVLASEGLSPRLREVILYGIAMCDSDQEPPPSPPAAEAGTADATPSVAAGGSGLDGDGSCASAANETAALPRSGALMTGAEDGAALELFTSSQGRFGHEGAFMVPSYGWGSVSEAFVRLCAVHGAVTVLRQPVQALVVSDGAAGAADGTAAVEAVAATEAAAAATATTAAEKEEEGVAECESEQGQRAASDGSGSSGSSSGGSGGPGTCVAIVTAAGQVVKCSTVVLGAGTLRCLEHAPAAAPQEYVSRAAVVLDGPLLGPTPQQQQQQAPLPAGARSGPAPPSLLTLVVPPRSAGLGASAPRSAVGDQGCGAGGEQGGGLGNPHPVRALQAGASTCVCPAGRFLLYLSTPATSASSSAYDDLWPSLAALTDTSGLRDITPGAATTTTATHADSDPTPSALSATDTDGPSLSSSAAASAPGGSSPAGPSPPAPCSRPRALRAWFYRQPVLHRSSSPSTTVAAAGAAAGAAGAREGAASWGLPGGVVVVPGPDGSLAGYGQVLRATEAAFRSAFPGVAFLPEVDFSGQAGGSGGGGEDGGGGGGASFEGEDDAIDELTAAVARLKDA